MIVKTISLPSLNDEIKEKIEHDVVDALKKIMTVDNQFIINNSLWFKQKSKEKANPCVMNAAEFNLVDLGWNKEKDMSNQRIDAFIVIEKNEPGYSSPLNKFPYFMAHYFKDHAQMEFDIECAQFYRKYVKRSIYDMDESLCKYREFFQQYILKESTKIRVGLEFEAGNIASAFRAFSKLDTLYYLDLIDLGVFITSYDKKTTAAQIWPSSNRNGSYEELKQRNYKKNIIIPLCEFSFQPDSLSASAPYLGRDGKLYNPVSTGQRINIHQEKYEIYTKGDNEKVLKKV